MTEKAPRTFGSRLKEARLRRDMSQEDIAKLVGISQITFSRYERNSQDPNTDTLWEISKILRVSTDWLLGEHEDVIDHSSMEDADYELVISYPSVRVFIEEETLSREAIDDIDEYIGFIRERDRRRRRPTQD